MATTTRLDRLEKSVRDTFNKLEDAEAISAQLQSEKHLTELQERAIALILAGKIDTEIMKELELSRTTLWRWKAESPRFMLRLAEERERLRQRTKDRLSAMIDRAFEVIEAKMAEGDIAAARLIVQACGLLDTEARARERTIELEHLGRLRYLDAEGQRRADLIAWWEDYRTSTPEGRALYAKMMADEQEEEEDQERQESGKKAAKTTSTPDAGEAEETLMRC
jgi:hypothetical protein